MEEAFAFEIEGTRLIGTLHRPAGTPEGAVVLTGPLTSVKEQAAGAYARALASQGYAALAFDHRYFGESGGKPRQFENPMAKVEDLVTASDALRRDARTNGLKLYAVGVCAGAGYMAHAAAGGGGGFTAFAGVAGYYAEATSESIAAARSTIARGEAAEKRFRDYGFAETIPAVAPEGGDVGMPLREAFEFYGTPRGAVPNYVNGFAVQSMAYTARFNAVDVAKRITIPTLLVHSEHALAPSLARKFFAELAGPREELWLSSRGQIDFYDDPALIAPAIEAIAQWFGRHP